MDTMFEIVMAQGGREMVRICDSTTLVYLLRLQALAIEADPQAAERASSFSWKELK